MMPKIDLSLDVCGLHDQHLVHHMILDRHSQNLASGFLGFGRSLGELDTTRLTPSTGVNLGFHRNRRAELLRDRARLGWGFGHRASVDRNSERFQHICGLIFVDIHRW